MSRKAHQQRSQRVLNVAWLVGSVVLFGLLAVAIYFWHGYQLNRTAQALVDRAAQLEEEKSYVQATNYLHRYLRIRPEDDEARVRLAEIYDRTATTAARKSRAVDLYYRALGVAPERLDLRRQLAQRLFELERYGAAIEQAHRVLAVEPDDVPLLRVTALSAFRQFRAGRLSGDEIRPLLQNALDRGPQDIALVEVYAELQREYLRQPDAAARGELADGAMDRMVEAAGHTASAYLARYRYRRRYGLEGAADDLQAALGRAPRDPAVLFQAARDAAYRLAHEEAAALYGQLAEVAPRLPDAHLGLGESLAALGRHEEALRAWQQGLRASGLRNVPLNLRMADSMIDHQQLDEAAPLLDIADEEIARAESSSSVADWRAAQRSADFVRARWHLGRGEDQQAQRLLRRVAASSGPHPAGSFGPSLQFRAGIMQGELHSRAGQWDLAAMAFEQAASIDPAQAAAYAAAAQAWARAQRIDAAVAACEKALALDQQLAEIKLLHARLQITAQLSGPRPARDWKLVGQLVQEAESSDPGWLEAGLLRAEWLAARGGEEAAQGVLEVLRAAEIAHSGSPDYWERAALLYQRVGHVAEADRAIAELAARATDELAAPTLRGKLLARRGQFDEARSLLSDALGAADEANRAALLRILVELEQRAGRPQQQQKYLRDLARLEPRQAAPVQQLAELALQQSDLEEATIWEQRLREIEGGEGSYWRLCRARRLLQQATDPQDQAAAIREAVELQHQIAAQRPWWHAAEVLKAVIAERQGHVERAIESYQTAIRLGSRHAPVFKRTVVLLLAARRPEEVPPLLEQLVELTSAIEPEYRLLLANYYESTGNGPGAEAQYEMAAAQNPDLPAALTALADFLLRKNQLEQAARWLDELERVAPDASATARLRTRWLATTGRGDDIEPYIESFAQRLTELEAADDRQQMLLSVAQLYDSVSREELAEDWYRRLAEEFPVTYPRLAEWLSARGRTREAIRLCIDAARTESVSPAAITVAQVLARGRPDPEDYALAEPLLGRALEQHADDAEVVLAVGKVRLKQHRVEEAIELLERVTQLDPENVLAWNNLAALLAEQPDARARALGCIDRAIALAGSLPTLLDTKAAVLIGQQRYDEAISILRSVVSAPGGSDPRFLFHLSLAYAHAGATDEARQARARAEELGLRDQYLTLQEQDRLARLDKRLAQ